MGVGNVAEAIRYWQDVLGFQEKWTWGDPPTHGGVSWHGARVQFSQNPKLASASRSTALWMRVRNVNKLFELHQLRNAEIVFPLTDEPWGMREYAVKDLNGYHITFSGPSHVHDKAKAPQKQFRIVSRLPTATEYRHLINAVGWSEFVLDEHVEKKLANILTAVVAEDPVSGEAVGCALLLGDDASFYYVKDVMVLPGWQGQGVGTAVMNAITLWLDSNGKEKALVGLYTGEGLTGFYKRFGFTEAFGMIRRLPKKD